MNVEGVFQHILTDLYAFIVTAIAAVVILATGFNQADAIAALFVAALMLRAAASLLRDSGRIFLEAAPAGIDPNAVGHELAAYPGVVSVHDLHVWEVTSGFPSLSAHVVVGWDDDCHDCRAGLEQMLHERFGIDHTTLQVEHQPNTLLTIEHGLDDAPPLALGCGRSGAVARSSVRWLGAPRWLRSATGGVSRRVRCSPHSVCVTKTTATVAFVTRVVGSCDDCRPKRRERLGRESSRYRS